MWLATKLLSMGWLCMLESCFILDKGCIRHALVRINNEFECSIELIRILLERLLGVLDNFKDIVGLLKLMDVQYISLSKPTERSAYEVTLPCRSCSSYMRWLLLPKYRKDFAKKASSCLLSDMIQQ